MTKIILIPAVLAILFGILLLFVPSLIEGTIKKPEEKEASLDKWVIENRMIVGIVSLIFGAIMVYASFV